MDGNASASDEAVEGAIEQLVLQSVQTQSALVQLQLEHRELRETLASKHKAYENKLQTLLTSNKSTESKLTALQRALQQQQRQRQQQQQQQQQAQQQQRQQQQWQEQQQHEQAQQQHEDQKQQSQPLLPQLQQPLQQDNEQLFRELVQEDSIDIAQALSQGAAPLLQPAEQQQLQGQPSDAPRVSEPVCDVQQQQQQQHAERENGGDAAMGEAQPPSTNGEVAGTSHSQHGQQNDEQQQQQQQQQEQREQQQHSGDTKPAASRRGKRKLSGAGETELFDKKLAQELKGTMKQVLVALKKNKEIAEDFLEPVWELWPEDIRREDYVRQVPEPMDLKTLGKLVNEGAFELTYQGYEHFKSKLHLIGNNCINYNRGDKEFCRKAQAFIDESSKIWEQKWDEVVSKVFSSGRMP